MITPKLSFDSHERTPFDGAHAYFHPAFFRGEMRRSWPKTICYTLFLFFVLPLPLLFEASGHPHWTMNQLSGSLTGMLNDGTWLYCLAAVAVALFAGMLATIYLCRRTSVDFYHSLPIRREGLLLQNWLCGMLHFGTALLFNVLLSMLVLFSAIGQPAMIGAPIAKLLMAAGYMLLTYLLFYTMTVFCGMLCGTSFMQIAVTGLLLGAFPLFRALALAFCNMVTDTVDISYYFDGNWGWTSPILRLVHLAEANTTYIPTENGTEMVFYSLENPFTWWEILLWIAAAGAFYFGAMWLYRHRHVERAGTPVVFEGVAVAVKWVVILLATMAVGWLFGEIGSGAGWFFFGFVLGGLLSFMLINTILTKNPKQMFRGWRAIVIYLVAFCIGSVGIGYAVSEVEDIVPKKIERLSIYFTNDNYSVPYYTDPAVIAAWQELWESEMKKGSAVTTNTVEAVTYADEKMGQPQDTEANYRFRERSVSIRAYVQVGPFIIAYRQRSIERSDAEDFLRVVTESAEFEAGWDIMMAEVAGRHIPGDENDWYDNYARVNIRTLFGDFYRERTGVSDSVNELFTTSVLPLREDVLALMAAEQPQDIGFEFFQSPIYAGLELGSFPRVQDDRLSYTSSGYIWCQYYVGMNEPAIYREVLGMSETEFYGALADTVLRNYGGLYVARRVNGMFSLGSGNVVHITDRGQIIEILQGMCRLDTKLNAELSPFTVLDEDYGVIFSVANSSDVICFIKGKTPAFVSGLFH